MKKSVRQLLMFLFIVGIAFTVVSCEGTLDFKFGLDAGATVKTVQVGSTTAIGGATVTITLVKPKDAGTTQDPVVVITDATTGTKTTTKALVAGAYKVTGELAGYYFYAKNITIGSYVDAITVEGVAYAASTKVINAKTGAGISGATVTLKHLTNTAQANVTGTSATDGTVKFSTSGEVLAGLYSVTTTLTGYAFVTQQETIQGVNFTFDPIPGFAYTVGTDATNISIITLWNTSFDDVDAYLYTPGINVATTNGTAPTFTTPYDVPTAANVKNGFGLDTTGRYRLYYSKPSSASDSSATWDATTYKNTLNKGTKDFKSATTLTANDTFMIELDVDNSGASTQIAGGPETVTIRTFPFYETATNSSTTGGVATGLPSLSSTSGFYTWVGVMDFYIDAYKKDHATNTTSNYLSTTTNTNSAEAVVYVLQGSTTLGVYTVPTWTDVKAASIIRINCFYNNSNAEVYQIVPNIKVLQTISEAKNLSNDNGIIVVEGRTR